MRLSETVAKSDIEEAVRLIKTAMQQSATDPKTGEIDMDIIATGVSSTSTKKIKEVSDVIKKITVSFLLLIFCSGGLQGERQSERAEVLQPFWVH